MKERKTKLDDLRGNGKEKDDLFAIIRCDIPIPFVTRAHCTALKMLKKERIFSKTFAVSNCASVYSCT